MEKIIVNGEMLERNGFYVDIEDRGYQFGDGIYEVIRVYEGRMYTQEEHLNRLYESAGKIGLNISYTKEELTDHLEKLIQSNQLDTGIIYMQFTRGASPRQHAFPVEPVPASYVAYTKVMARPEVFMKEGVKGHLVEDIRWLRCDIKSLNLLGNIMAKQSASEAGCFEAIQHRGETVTEGSSSNVFIVKEGAVITHPATNLILNGITRQEIQKLCSESGIVFEEREFTVTNLMAADEVFIASTTSEVMPIVEIDNTVIGDGKPGQVTKQLQTLFWNRVVERAKLAI
ncbi:D-amino-acid transaminase [Falsibacillus albus]|uniref:D-alanine aminotransferase n=1 Tax=Falsibacillus albus TaxID=2478915 RepID=A0A3L7K6H9_9BACI|nr:D-amino-acid transaminase [Falsibacillus albus]RLQ97884.1 D-amino-acid transaminase [Falsibacillus albus]